MKLEYRQLGRLRRPLAVVGSCLLGWATEIPGVGRDAERHESGGAVKQPRHAEKGEESGGSRGQPRAARASLPATISLVNRRLALVPIGSKPPDAVRLEFGQSYGQALGTCVREG